MEQHGIVDMAAEQNSNQIVQEIALSKITGSTQSFSRNKGHAIRLLSIIDGKLFFRNPHVHEAREDTLLLIRSLDVQSNDKVLEIGVGMGVGAVLIGQHVARFFGVDMNNAAVENTLLNASVNDLANSVDIRQGNCFQPFQGLKFDLIFSNPPQLPTPQHRERNDWVGIANNGGEDGRSVIDHILMHAHHFLNEHGRLFLMHMSINGVEESLQKLSQQGFETSIVASMEKPFGQLSYERLDYIQEKFKRNMHSSSCNHYNLFVIKAVKRA